MKAVLSCLVVVASLWNSGQLAAQASCPLSVPVIALASGPNNGFFANDLRATLKGKEITIKEVKPPPATRRIVFVLDRSGSMIGVRHSESGSIYDLDRWMSQGVEELLSVLPSNNSVAFLAFSGDQSTQTEFADPAMARSELPAILAWKPGKGTWNHRTPLWANIETALHMLSPRKDGDVIVAVSDGRDNMSTLSKNKIQNALLTSGVPVLAVMIANPYLHTLDSADGLRDFAGLADSTGGAAAFDDPALEAGFPMGAQQLFRPDQLIPLLAHQYELEMETPPIQKPEKWELKANSAAAGRKLDLLYPRYLLPCTETH